MTWIVVAGLVLLVLVVVAAVAFSAEMPERRR